MLGFLAMGDGWRNNHHRAPYSARHGFAWYEFDMTYSFIRLLAFFGLVWDLKQPPAELLAGEVSPREGIRRACSGSGPGGGDRRAEPTAVIVQERAHVHRRLCDLARVTPVVRPQASNRSARGRRCGYFLAASHSASSRIAPR